MTHDANMVFAFVDTSPSFVNGFEAGMIWQQIEDGLLEIDRGFDDGFPVHAENIVVIQRIASARNYHLETKETGVEGWVAVRLTFVARKAAPALKVVQ
jgi:hypothetical protein